MIADIYKCPQCDCNVYLAQDEDYCPLCAENDRDHMELVELGVDLEEDSNLDEPRYANFDHLLEVLQFRFGYDAANYAIDCWKYAWDATKTDLANADKLNAFLDNPNGIVTGQGANPMTKEEMHAEIERIISLILSKCKFPRNQLEIQENILYKFESYNPLFRIYVRKDLTYIAAEVCYKHTHTTSVYNYNQLEKYRAVPKKKDGYFVFRDQIPIDTNLKSHFKDYSWYIAERITNKVYAPPVNIPSWIKKTFLWKLSKKYIAFATDAETAFYDDWF